jgi:serine/threonine protein phosphatase PrpC
MQVRFWAATHPGRAREQNEDNFLVDKKLNLFIVADGMGGHAAGEIASSVAVREVRRVIAERRAVIERYVDEESTTGRQQLLALIVDAIRQACARIFEMAQEGTERRGMGTTLCMLMIAGRRGFLGHVGDSRIYMLRNNVVEQLTEDHSLVNELIKRGRLKPGDVFDSPYKNAVTRAVGVYETVEVDTLDFDILPGDNFLLCSDGLSCYLENDLTRDYLSLESVKDIPDRFIEFANESGGKDNITSVVVRILPDQDELANERLQEVRLKLDTLRAIPMFKYLSYKGLVKVMNITDAQRVTAGTAIFEEGTRGEELYLLLHGRVAIEKGGQRLAELGAGGHFGEMAMVDKSPRSATARALEDCRLLVIQRQQFYEVMRRDPSMAVKLMWSFIQVLNTRLRITNDELLRARDTIESIRLNGAGVVADLPPAEHSLAAFGVLPVGPTDELVPGFLFADSEQPQTDPAVRIDPNSPALSYPDLDLRPGLPVPPSAEVAAGSSPPESIEAEEIETAGFEDDRDAESKPPTAPEAPVPPESTPGEAEVPDEALPLTLTAMPALRPRPMDTDEEDGIEARSTIDLKRSPRRSRLPDDPIPPPDDEDE